MFADISKGKSQVIGALDRKKMRQKHGLFAIEGRKSVADILFRYPSRFCVEYIVAEENWLEEFAPRCQGELGLDGARIFRAAAAQLKSLSSLSTPPEVIAVCRLPEPLRVELTLAPGLYLMLDGVQDPGNLGTIIRTAHWFGVTRIFASPSTADIYNPKTIQASMGSMAAVEVIYTDLEALRAANPGIPLCGLMLDGENLFETELPESAFIVMGNEGNGVSEELRRRLDISLTIPPGNPADHAESLNVAIATAITLARFRNP